MAQTSNLPRVAGVAREEQYCTILGLVGVAAALPIPEDAVAPWLIFASS